MRSSSIEVVSIYDDWFVLFFGSFISSFSTFPGVGVSETKIKLISAKAESKDSCLGLAELGNMSFISNLVYTILTLQSCIIWRDPKNVRISICFIHYNRKEGILAVQENEN